MISVGLSVSARAPVSRVAELPWHQLAANLTNHKVGEKDGPAFVPGVKQEGRRCADNATPWDLLVLDVESKDAQAPEVAETEKRVRTQGWAAAVATSWSHRQPGKGSRYRLIMPVDRPIKLDELKPVIAGAAELLGLQDCYDPTATDAARLFYLPRHPEGADPEAVIIEGEPVRVDALLAAGSAKCAQSEWAGFPDGVAPDMGRGNLTPQMAETPQNIALVQSALAAISANCSRGEWRDVVWSIAALGWSSGKQLARHWSMSAPEKFEENDFARVWADFKPGEISTGTLFHRAKEMGWIAPRQVVSADTATDGTGDLWNARLLAKREIGRLLYVPETNSWLRFEPGQGWLKADFGGAERAAKALVDVMRERAAEMWKSSPDDPKAKRLRMHVERSSSARALHDMIELLKSEPGMSADLASFDADPMLLGVANGVLDLRTLQMRPVEPNLLVSKRAAVAFEPSAACPRFEKFMAEILPDPTVRAFIQRWAGYILTGKSDAQAFVFLHGSGRNGKSVLIEFLAWLLGDYSRKIPTEMLMMNNRDPNAPAPEIVGLKGVRFAYTSETEESQRLASARVKELTGGDTLTGRVPYASQSVIFNPTHKLMMTGNHKPDIRDDSFGMWRRVLLVNFDVTIPEERVDYQLADKLRDEGAGILNWCLDGLNEYMRHGLNPPDAIKAATAAYKDENDVLGDWVAEHLERGATFSVSKSDIYRAYRVWCQSNGHGVLSANKLGRRLAERGMKNSDRRMYAGVRLTPDGVAASLRVL